MFIECLPSCPNWYLYYDFKTLFWYALLFQMWKCCSYFGIRWTFGQGLHHIRGSSSGKLFICILVNLLRPVWRRFLSNQFDFAWFFLKSIQNLFLFFTSIILFAFDIPRYITLFNWPHGNRNLLPPEHHYFVHIQSITNLLICINYLKKMTFTKKMFDFHCRSQEVYHPKSHSQTTSYKT